MGKKNSHSHRFSQSVDAVYAGFADPDIVRAKLEALGSRDIDIEIATDAGVTTVTIDRTVPLNVSESLKAMVGDTQKVRQTERWEGEVGGPYSATIDIEPVGVPASMHGETTLSADGDGCMCIATMEASCTIPLMGGKVEKMMIGDSDTKIAEEFAYIAQHC